MNCVLPPCPRPCARPIEGSRPPRDAPRVRFVRVNRMIDCTLELETRGADLAWGSGGRRGWRRKWPAGAGPRRRRGSSPCSRPRPRPLRPPPWRCRCRCRRSCCSPAPPYRTSAQTDAPASPSTQEDHCRRLPHDLALAACLFPSLDPKLSSSSSLRSPPVALSGSWAGGCLHIYINKHGKPRPGTARGVAVAPRGCVCDSERERGVNTPSLDWKPAAGTTISQC